MSKKIKLVYLASPYSSKCPDPLGQLDHEHSRYHEITKIAAVLIKKTGNAFFLPITQSHILRRFDSTLGTSFKFWEKIDKCALRHCDELWVIMMEGWDRSIGVQAEIAYMQRVVKRPVKFIKPEQVLRPKVRKYECLK